MTFDYFLNRTYSFNSSNTYISSSSYVGSNTFAYASSYGNYSNATAHSYASGSSNTSIFSSNSTSSSTVNKGVEYQEKEGVWIPAHSSRHFHEFSLLETPYRKCGLARNPSRKEDATISFSEDNSPYVFDNILTLKINGDEKRIINSFFVESITNILRDLTYTEEEKTDCNGVWTGEMVRIYKFRSANRFYIDYEFKTGTDRTKDMNSSSPNNGNKTFSDGVYNMDSNYQ